MSILNIVSIVCFAFCLIIFFYLKWLVNKKTSPSALLDEEYRKEVNKLIADINNAADRDSLLVEDRIKQLKKILEETDKRITVYEKILEEIHDLQRSQPRPDETLYTSLGKGIRAALSTEPPAEKKQEASVLIESFFPAANTAAPPDLSASAVSAEPSKKPPSKKQIRAHIDLLLNEGVAPEEIASQLEISVAEVNLAMNLRRV